MEIAGRRWRVRPEGFDLSIPLAFNDAQPRFFGAAAASAEPVIAGSFVGDVRRGGSCNCSTHALTPHCNGTHTECIGHVTEERLGVREFAKAHLVPALLLSVVPEHVAPDSQPPGPPARGGDRLITRAALQAAAGPYDLAQFPALVVRTLPNDRSKQHRDYDTGETSPYFSAEAMRWIVANDVHTLVVDLPSLDRADDPRLTTHRIFWGLGPEATALASASRPEGTVTELAFIDDAIADGPYLLNLQVAPFVADAAPSRPILLPLSPP